MDVCSGSNRDKHAEIAHAEGSTSCPLCEMKAERDELDKTNTELVADAEDFKAERDTANKELAELQEKTKHMAWAVETVEEPRT